MQQAIQMEISGIKCDARGCDYRDDDAKYEEYEKWLNKPCPKCGANLLTGEDMKTCQIMMQNAAALNSLVGPLPDDMEAKLYDVLMNGSGIPEFKPVKE